MQAPRPQHRDHHSLALEAHTQPQLRTRARRCSVRCCLTRQTRGTRQAWRRARPCPPLCTSTCPPPTLRPYWLRCLLPHARSRPRPPLASPTCRPSTQRVRACRRSPHRALPRRQHRRVRQSRATALGWAGVAGVRSATGPASRQQGRRCAGQVKGRGGRLPTAQRRAAASSAARLPHQRAAWLRRCPVSRMRACSRAQTLVRHSHLPMLCARFIRQPVPAPATYSFTAFYGHNQVLCGLRC